MSDPITTIQNSITGELAVLDKDQPGGYLVQRSAFNGKNINEIIWALELNTPAVVIAFKTADIDGGNFQKHDDVAIRFQLWCATANLRNQNAASEGSGIGSETPGAFQIAKDVIAALRHKRYTINSRDTLGINFTNISWIPSDGGLAIIRLECTIDLPQIDWGA